MGWPVHTFRFRYAGYVELLNKRNTKMETKNALLSKTLWVNLLLLAGTTLGVKELAPDLSGEIVVAVFAIINIVLRILTKEPIKFV